MADLARFANSWNTHGTSCVGHSDTIFMEIS